MRPGQITAVSASSRQGVYRPQLRIYFRNDRYGILFETLTKPVRCGSRSRAVALAKEWLRTPDGASAIERAKGRIAAKKENHLTP